MIKNFKDNKILDQIRPLKNMCFFLELTSLFWEMYANTFKEILEDEVSFPQLTQV